MTPAQHGDLHQRLRAILAAISVCMNDERVTDIGTIKRAWFYAETGRDEPCGNLSWIELIAIAQAALSDDARPTVPAVEGEAQNGLNDVALGDLYPVATILKGIRQRSIQALHAGLSRRDWHATEAAANEARDAIDRLLIRMGELP